MSRHCDLCYGEMLQETQRVLWCHINLGKRRHGWFDLKLCIVCLFREVARVLLCPLSSTQSCIYGGDVVCICRGKVDQHMQSKTKYNRRLSDRVSRIVLQQSVVLSPVKLSTVRLFLSTVKLSKIFGVIFVIIATGSLASAEVIAEAHSGVLLVLPLSCRLCRRAKLCTKTPFARDSAALQPVLSAQPLDLLPSYKNPSLFRWLGLLSYFPTACAS